MISKADIDATAYRRAALQSVTRITSAEPVLSDTLSNTAAIPQPTGETEMFRTDLTDYVVFFSLAFALVASLV